MIKSKRQYRVTKAQADKFEAALRHGTERSASSDPIHPLLRRAQADAIRSQLNDLMVEIEEYEQLISDQPTVVRLDSFANLPQALIKARIAAGLTQRQLGERLGLKEQQIQRYEATNYAGASLGRVTQVVEALGIDLSDDIVVAGQR